MRRAKWRAEGKRCTSPTAATRAVAVKRPIPGNGQELADAQRLGGGSLELLLDGADARVNLGDLLHGGEGGAQQARDARVGVLQQQADLGDDVVGADRKWQAEFVEQAPDGIDPGGAGGQPGRPQAVQGRQGLLGLRLHGHRVDIFVAKGFEQTLGVGTVGLVAQHIGPDHMRGHEDGLVAKAWARRAQWCAEPHASMRIVAAGHSARNCRNCSRDGRSRSRT